jgi:hypothetical protein
MKFIIEEKKRLKPSRKAGIPELYLIRNEYAGKKQMKPFNGTNQGDISSETDEDFEWYKKDPELAESESYFCLINCERRTLEAGEQAYYCYGDRTNRFLLLNYGFCYPDNKYDSYEIHMRTDVD